MRTAGGPAEDEKRIGQVFDVPLGFGLDLFRCRSQTDVDGKLTPGGSLDHVSMELNPFATFTDTHTLSTQECGETVFHLKNSELNDKKKKHIKNTRNLPG